MRDLVKNFSVRSLSLHVIFVAIIAVCIAGVSRHSLVLEWAPLVATFIVLVADPLGSQDKAGAAPGTSGVRNAAAKGKIPSSMERAKSAAGSGALISSGA